MLLIASTVFIVVLMGGIALVEHKGAQRSKAFFKRTDAMIEDLTRKVNKKYRERYGKDPTGAHHLYTERDAKRK